MSRTWPTEEEWARWRLEQASARAETYRGKSIEWDKINALTAEVFARNNCSLTAAIFQRSVDLAEQIRTYPARMEAEHGPDWRDVLQERRRRMQEYIENDQDEQLVWGE